MLSQLTGDDRYGCAARGALLGLFLRGDKQTGLHGKHIDVVSGNWVEESAGIGSTSDSFYEYLAKLGFLFGDKGALQMFGAASTSIEAHSRFGHW